MSDDGRFVAFTSYATNLVTGGPNVGGILVKDRLTGTVTLASVSSEGVHANQDCDSPVISGDGKWVAFDSHATNLVPGDTNNHSDIFVHDLTTGQTKRASVSSIGLQGDGDSYLPSLSVDGKFIAFESYASTLVPSDSNNRYDVFVHNMSNGLTERISVTALGAQGNDNSGSASISANGRYVAFDSYADNFIANDVNISADVFVKDRQTKQLILASCSTGGAQAYECHNPSISADGSLVAFQAEGSTLVDGDTNGCQDVFVRQLQTSITSRVSVSSTGVEGDFESFYALLSADGRFVVFESYASNFASNDTNNYEDTYIHQLAEVPSWKLSVESANPNSGVAITVWNPDDNHLKSGITSFSRTYSNGWAVAMTAPATAGANWFAYWMVDGAKVPGTGRTLSVTMLEPHSVKAVYGPSRTLTVRSENPPSGVSIRVWQPDIQGQAEWQH